MQSLMQTEMKRAISNVLETMFFRPVQFVEYDHSLDEWFACDELICACLDFNGPAVGCYYLLMPGVLALSMTADFLGLDAGQIGSVQKEDTVKEALNMIGGAVLSFVDTRSVYQLTIPRITPLDDSGFQRFWNRPEKALFIETDNNRLAAGIVANLSGERVPSYE